MFEFIISHWGWFAFGAYLLFALCLLTIAGSNTREEIELYGARPEDLPPGALEEQLALRLANSKRIPLDD